jgi:hypothetical protein
VSKLICYENTVDKNNPYFPREEWITAQIVRGMGGNIYLAIASIKIM